MATDCQKTMAEGEHVSSMPQFGRASEAAGAPSYEPYARLLTLLLPRLRNLAVFDGLGSRVWTTPDWDLDFDADFVRDAMADSLTDESDIPALGRAIDADRGIYAFVLRTDSREILAIVCLEVANQGTQSTPRPAATLRPFLQPALECLRRELLLGASAPRADAPRSARPQVVPLPTVPVNDIDALDAVLRCAFDHVGCALAALWIPERELSLSLAPSGKRMSPQLLRLPQQQLFSAMGQEARTIVLNNPVPAAAGGAAPYRILGCPIRWQDGRLAGVLALFNPPSVADFQPAQARAAELMATCLGALIRRGRPAA